MSDEVLVDVADGIMTVTLNRPEAKNAANKALAEGVAAAMDELDSNDEIRVAILTGAGGTFCSGMDLKAFVSGETPTVEGRGFGGLTEKPPAKPLIAAVEGYALAGGLELMISCDLIVAADNAKFGIPEVKRGLAAAAGGLVRLPRQVPPRLAMELALTGDFISAERAAEMGLINRVVPAGTALDAARELAATICANGPLAVKAVTRSLREHQEHMVEDDAMVASDELAGPVFASNDAREGMKAFKEKRPARFTGS